MQRLDATVANRLRDDPTIVAVWDSVRHVERTARMKNGAPAPVPVPAPASATASVAAQISFRIRPSGPLRHPLHGEERGKPSSLRLQFEG